MGRGTGRSSIPSLVQTRGANGAWPESPGAADPGGEQGCLVTWKEAGSETKEESAVERRRHQQLQVPFVGSSGAFKS